MAHRKRDALAEKIEPRVIAGRVPPHDLDTEAAVLGSILLDSESIDKVASFLKPEHFYSESNGRIFEAATELTLAGTPLDIVSVASWLRDRGRFAQIGGASYLAQLTDATPAVAHIDAHARIITEKWRLRQIIATCQRTAAEGYGDVESVQDFIDAHESVIEELRRSSGTNKDPVRVDVVAREAFGAMQRQAANGGLMLGRSTGFVRLDHKVAGLHDGETYVVAARPGHGKSAAVINMAVNVASPVPQMDEDGRETDQLLMGGGVGVFSLEMPREQLVQRMFCSEARVDVGKLRSGYLQSEDWNRLTTAASFIAPLPIWIDDTPGLTLAMLRSKATTIAREAERYGTSLRLIIIDYLQLMRGSGREKSAEEVVAENSKGLKELAKMLKIPIIIVAQLNRDSEKRGKAGRPQLIDLRSSGAIEMDADTVMFIYNRDVASGGKTMTGIAEWIIAKQRSGPLGTILVRYLASCTRFEDFAPHDYPTEHDEAA